MRRPNYLLQNSVIFSASLLFCPAETRRNMAALQTLPSTKSPLCAFCILLDVPPGRGFGFCSIVTNLIRIMECYRVTGGGGDKEAAALTASSQMFFSARHDDNRLADVPRRPRESLGATWTETRSRGCLRWRHSGDAAGFLLSGLRDAVRWRFFRFPSHKNARRLGDLNHAASLFQITASLVF